MRSSPVLIAVTAAACSASPEATEDVSSWECGDAPLLLQPLADGERAIVYEVADRLLFDVVGGERRELRSTDRCGGDAALLGVELGRPKVLASARVLACDGDALVDVDPTGARAPAEVQRGVDCDSAVDTPHGLLVSGTPDGWVRPLLLDGVELLPAVYDVALLPGADALVAVTGQGEVVRVDLATRAAQLQFGGAAVRIDLAPDGEAFVWQAFPGAGPVQPLYLYRDGQHHYLTEGYTPLSPPFDEVVWTADGANVFVVGEFNDLIGMYDGTTGAPVTPPEHHFLGGDWPAGSRLSDGSVLLSRVEDGGETRTLLRWSPATGETTELWSDAASASFNDYFLDVGDGLARIVREDAFRIDGTLWHWSFDGTGRELGPAGLYMTAVDGVALSVVPDHGVGPVRAIDLDDGSFADLDDGATAIPAPVAFGDFVVYQKPDGLWAAALPSRK